MVNLQSDYKYRAVSVVPQLSDRMLAHLNVSADPNSNAVTFLLRPLHTSASGCALVSWRAQHLTDHMTAKWTALWYLSLHHVKATCRGQCNHCSVQQGQLVIIDITDTPEPPRL